MKSINDRIEDIRKAIIETDGKLEEVAERVQCLKAKLVAIDSSFDDFIDNHEGKMLRVDEVKDEIAECLDLSDGFTQQKADLLNELEDLSKLAKEDFLKLS